jgi:hypothetical protein
MRRRLLVLLALLLNISSFASIPSEPSCSFATSMPSVAACHASQSEGGAGTAAQFRDPNGVGDEDAAALGHAIDASGARNLRCPGAQASDNGGIPVTGKGIPTLSLRSCRYGRITGCHDSIKALRSMPALAAAGVTDCYLAAHLCLASPHVAASCPVTCNRCPEAEWVDPGPQRAPSNAAAQYAARRFAMRCSSAAFRRGAALAWCALLYA